MEIIPFGDRVTVELIPDEEKTESGIYLPDNNSTKQVKGIIKCLGEGTEETEKILKTIKVGDTILFNKNVGTRIKDGNTIFIVLDVRDIIGILK